MNGNADINGLVFFDRNGEKIHTGDRLAWLDWYRMKFNNIKKIRAVATLEERYQLTWDYSKGSETGDLGLQRNFFAFTRERKNLEEFEIYRGD
jgi:hypothetical protein